MDKEELKQNYASIHTLRVEGDSTLICSLKLLKFQSTPSAWRVTRCGKMTKKYDWISIHTLRVEGDQEQL